MVGVPRGACSSGPLPERPTPERCVEAYYLQRTRFENIVEAEIAASELLRVRVLAVTLAVLLVADQLLFLFGRDRVEQFTQKPSSRGEIDALAPVPLLVFGPAIDVQLRIRPPRHRKGDAVTGIPLNRSPEQVECQGIPFPLPGIEVLTLRWSKAIRTLSPTRVRRPRQPQGSLLTPHPNRTNGLRSVRRHPARANVGGDAMNPPRVRQHCRGSSCR